MLAVLVYKILAFECGLGLNYQIYVGLKCIFYFNFIYFIIFKKKYLDT